MLDRRNYVGPHDGRRRPAPTRLIRKARLVAKRLYRIHREPNPWLMSLGGEQAARELATYRYSGYWVEIVADCGHVLQREWLWPPGERHHHRRGGRYVRCEQCR